MDSLSSFFPIWCWGFINIRSPFAIIGLASANLSLSVFLLWYLRHHLGEIKYKLTYFTDRLRNLCDFFFFYAHLFEISANGSHWNAHTWLLKMCQGARWGWRLHVQEPQEEAGWCGCGPVAACCTTFDGDQHERLGGTLTLAQTLVPPLSSCVTLKNHLDLLNGALSPGMGIELTSWDCHELSIFWAQATVRSAVCVTARHTHIHNSHFWNGTKHFMK